MKYFIDTEFHEYQKKPLFGKPIDTIELISIGIVSEEIIEQVSDTGRRTFLHNGTYINHDMFRGSKEYYAICKEFDLKAAWKNEWLRENVLPGVLEELIVKEHASILKEITVIGYSSRKQKEYPFTFKSLKYLLNKYGKTKKQIAEDILVFTDFYTWRKPGEPNIGLLDNKDKSVEFYAYCADYDWVVFCWLFGRMIDLPTGFPMYCIDLKQELDRKIKQDNPTSFEARLHNIQMNKNYPKQTNEHNALSDAKWNYELYKFLNTL